MDVGVDLVAANSRAGELSPDASQNADCPLAAPAALNDSLEKLVLRRCFMEALFQPTTLLLLLFVLVSIIVIRRTSR